MISRKFVVILIVVGLGGFGLGVYADLISPPPLNSVPKLIPYQGNLEKDGALVNAIEPDRVNFRVSLWDDLVVGNQVWPAAGTYEQHSVNVYNGRFAFNIGSAVPYEHIVDTSLFLDIQVMGPGEADFVQLGGRQQFLSAPYAVAAAQADLDFTVPGHLSASSIATVGSSSVSIQDATIDSTDQLNLQTTSLTDTVVGGNLQVGDSITSGAGIISANMSCRSVDCGMVQNDLPGSMYFGTWRAWQYCPEGMYVCGARQRIEWDCGGCDDTAMNALSIACCPF